MATPAERAEFDRMVASGTKPEEAAMLIKQMRQQQPQQLNTTSSGDAIAGGLSNPFNLGGPIAGIKNVVLGQSADSESSLFDDISQRYKAGKESFDTDWARANQDHPFVAGLAQGAVSAPMLGAAPFSIAGAGGGVNAAAAGAQYGLASAAGKIVSNPDMGAQAALDEVNTETSLGAVTGPIAEYGISKPLGWLGRKAMSAVTPTASGAEALSRGIDPSKLSQIGANRTVGAQLERTGELEAKYPMKFLASQATGDPEAALAEDVAQGLKEPARNLAGMKAQQGKDVETTLQMVAKDIAANPDKLGKQAVIEEVAAPLQEHIDSLFAKRTSEATQDYPKAWKLLGTKKHNTTSAIKPITTELQDLPANATSTAASLKRTLDALHSADESAVASTGTSSISGDLVYGGEGATRTIPEASLKDIRIEQKFWADKAADYSVATTADRLATAQERALARRISTSLQTVLDKAADEGSGPAFDAFRAANARYKANSQAIDDAAPEIVNMLLKKSETDTADSLTSKLLNPTITTEQTRGVMGILNKVAPDAAQNLRGQIILEMGTKHGAAELGTTLGANKQSIFKATPAYEFYLKNASKLEAIYEGDQKSQLALRDVGDILERLGSSPTGVANAPGALSAAATATASSQGGITGRNVLSTVKAVLTNERIMAKAVSTPEGVALLNKLLRTAKPGYNLTDAMARSLMDEAAQLGWTEAAPEIRAGARRLAQD